MLPWLNKKILTMMNYALDKDPRAIGCKILFLFIYLLFIKDWSIHFFNGVKRVSLITWILSLMVLVYTIWIRLELRWKKWNEVISLGKFVSAFYLYEANYIMSYSVWQYIYDTFNKCIFTAHDPNCLAVHHKSLILSIL